MKALIDRIKKDGLVKDGGILNVSTFLNHQMDIKLFNEMGKEFKDRFKNVKIDKILTLESSGIGIAVIVAQHFDVPVVFAKKSMSVNLDGAMLSAEIFSHTRKKSYEVIVESKFIDFDENILIIDDFLANGNAALGLCELVNSAHGNVVGLGFAIEKSYQGGAQMLQDKGYRVESLAVIEKMNENINEIIFK